MDKGNCRDIGLDVYEEQPGQVLPDNPQHLESLSHTPVGCVPSTSLRQWTEEQHASLEAGVSVLSSALNEVGDLNSALTGSEVCQW